MCLWKLMCLRKTGMLPVVDAAISLESSKEQKQNHCHIVQIQKCRHASLTPGIRAYPVSKVCRHINQDCNANNKCGDQFHIIRCAVSDQLPNASHNDVLIPFSDSNLKVSHTPVLLLKKKISLQGACCKVTNNFCPILPKSRVTLLKCPKVCCC